MKDGTIGQRQHLFTWARSGLLLLALACTLNTVGRAQNTPAKPESTAPVDVDAPAVTLPATATPEDRNREAWAILTDAAGDTKHTQTRIQALAALALLRSPRSAKMIAAAMTEPDLDIRTAAVLAAGQTRDRNLTTNLRNLLDDKEPEVAFAAAMTLWKMGDRSGEDILMAVVDGDRSAGPTMIHGAKHKVSKDLHDPAMLARVGAIQAASMFFGPLGYGVAAYEYVHQNGGDLARMSAIEQVSQEETEPIHKELVAALGDKDPAVRAAAAKALADYHDKATSMALYALFVDSKYPVRLTSAAAYLRTTGTPGPSAAAIARGAASAKH